MAKDPAMLWYWSDWHSGTITLSRFLKGCYMDVLHAQFNSGHLSLEEIKTVLGSDFGTAWPTILKKFKVDDTGKFFNERLEEEQLKRANFTASRRRNLESTHMDKHMDVHTDQRMENVNEDVKGLKEKELKIVSRESEDEQKGPKPLEQDEFKPLSDAWFNYIFDENYLAEKAMTFREHDIGGQLQKFKSKVIGAPRDYIYRDTSGVRKAFDYQLRNTKPDKQYKNGRAANKRSSDAVIEPGRDFGSFG